MVNKNELVVEPTPLNKYARQNGFIFPRVRGEQKKIFELPVAIENPPGFGVAFLYLP